MGNKHAKHEEKHSENNNNNNNNNSNNNNNKNNNNSNTTTTISTKPTTKSKAPYVAKALPEAANKENFEDYLREYQKHDESPSTKAEWDWFHPPHEPVYDLPTQYPNYLQPIQDGFDHEIKILLQYIGKDDDVIRKNVVRVDSPGPIEDHRCVGVNGKKVLLNFVNTESWQSMGSMYNTRDSRASTFTNGKFHGIVFISDLEPMNYIDRILRSDLNYKDRFQFMLLLVLYQGSITQEDKDKFYKKIGYDNEAELIPESIVIKFIQADPQSPPSTNVMGPIEVEVCKLVHFLMEYVRPRTLPRSLHTTTTSEAMVMSGDISYSENQTKLEYQKDPPEIQAEREKLLLALKPFIFGSTLTGEAMEKLISEFPKWFIRSIDPSKQTLLHYICKSKKENEEGLLKSMQYLLDHGADPNAKDVQGMTPLHKASSNGLVKFTQILVKHKGVDINIKDQDSGASPLMHACYEQHVEVIKVLVAAGADVKLRNSRDLTPMQYIRGAAVAWGVQDKYENSLSALGFPGTIDFPGND